MSRCGGGSKPLLRVAATAAAALTPDRLKPDRWRKSPPPSDPSSSAASTSVEVLTLYFHIVHGLNSLIRHGA